MKRLLLGVLCLAACSPETTNLFSASAPTAQDLKAALPGELAHGVQSCSAGAQEGTPVQVCNVCTVTVNFNRDDSAGDYLSAVLSGGSMAFRRAFSHDQPDIEPGPGQAGVWVTVSSSLRQMQESRLAESLQTRAGFQTIRRTGLQNPLRSMPDGVWERLRSDTQLQRDIAASVGGCG